MEIITNVPIQLLSVCSTQGELKPLWFRFEDEEHQICKINIDKIISHKEINYVGMKMLQFICGARIFDCERIFELRYNIVSHKWSFYQMLS